MIVRRLLAAGRGWSEDQAAQMGAALAYYTLFSLTPLLVLVMAVVGAVVGEGATRGQVVEQVRGFIDADSAAAVEAMLDNFRTTPTQAATSVVGLLSLCFGATGMFTSLRASLHRIWRLGNGGDGVITGLVKTYLTALLMIFVSCVFLVALIGAGAITPVLYAWSVEQAPALPRTALLIDFAASTFLLTMLFAFTFRFLSDGRIAYRKLWGGAFVSAALFTAGKMGIGFYLSYANLASAYGAAGSLVVFLAWVYYSAQIVFFGAEVIRFGLPAAAQPAGR
ncbi:MAG: YihY/virulence factor BrkB family protein [Gemmataceae bacterium]